MGMIREFKEFAMRGNVLDLAVGIIIGAAFTTIVTSFVNDLIMPPIGVVTGGVDFKDKKYVMAPPVTDKDGKVIKPAAELRYGNFINAVINFLIVAFAVFLLIKAVNTATRKLRPPPPVGEPTNKECPLCCSSIPYRAKKCPHCTAELPAMA
jgi:large conductance mechanosensitive channel